MGKLGLHDQGNSQVQRTELEERILYAGFQLFFISYLK